MEFDSAHTSDLSRCLETATIALRGHERMLCREPRLREMAYGRWEGLSFAEVRKKFPEEAEAYRRDGVTTRITDGESLADVAERTKQFMDELLQEAPKRALIVTHGGALKALLFGILGLDLRHRGRFVIDNASLTIVSAGGGGRPRLLRMNDVSHLEEPLP